MPEPTFNELLRNLHTIEERLIIYPVLRVLTRVMQAMIQVLEKLDKKMSR